MLGGVQIELLFLVVFTWEIVGSSLNLIAKHVIAWKQP